MNLWDILTIPELETEQVQTLDRDSDPDAVEAHLAYVAEEVLQTRLSAAGEQLKGRIRICARSGELRFHPELYLFHPDLFPEPGAAVTLDYVGHGVPFRFQSVVTRITDEGGIVLERPDFIAHAKGDLVHRHRPMGDRMFHLRLRRAGRAAASQPFPMLDISTDGLCFLFWPHLAKVKPGSLIWGQLQLPGAEAFAVRLRIERVEPIFEGASRCMAETRFVNLSLEERLELAMSIHIWERLQKVA